MKLYKSLKTDAEHHVLLTANVIPRLHSTDDDRPFRNVDEWENLAEDKWTAMTACRCEVTLFYVCRSRRGVLTAHNKHMDNATRHQT